MLIDSKINKQKILNHFLEICLFEGWSQKALEMAFVKSEIANTNNIARAAGIKPE
jgi:hypothetical protein